MKNLLFLMILIAFCAISQKPAAQTPRYEINGKIEGAEGVKFILQKSSAGKAVYLDSAVVVNGMFKITGGSVVYPEMVYLVVPEKRKALSFFLENSVITITGKLDSLTNAQVTGSKSQDEFSAFLKSTRPLYDKMTKLANDYKAANEATMTEIKTAQKEFVRNNPGSFVSPVILSSMIREMKSEEVESMINALDPEVAKSPVAVEIKSRISAARSVVVGQKAPDFILNDVKGKPVSLSSKIGSKLLLIDFWAGWCAPCRQENPNVLKVYNEFKKKGFDIIGVSLDRTKDEWVKAINDDKLPWTQVSDLNYFNSAAAKLFNVTAIPANFLLDEKGIIIAVNLRGEALYNRIKGILVTGTVTDIDGNVYSTVTIGKQVWMTENLKTTKYRNGDPIPNVTDTAQRKKLTTGAYCNYNNDVNIAKTYGRLYNWYAVSDPRNIAPEGWHVASEAEWITLINYLGGEKLAARKLKESGTVHWDSINIATNESGFTALPGGYCNVNGIFKVIGKVGQWWTATEYSSASNSVKRVIDKFGSVELYISRYTDIGRQIAGKRNGQPVRCVRDQSAP